MEDKIGISTGVFSRKENWGRLVEFIDLGFKNIELYNKVTRIRLKDVEPLKKLKKSRNIKYTFHSMVQDLFCENRAVSGAESIF